MDEIKKAVALLDESELILLHTTSLILVLPKN